jgi:hypothetical protein
MKIIYEQGDIIFNENNKRCGFVIDDYEDNYRKEKTVKIIEVGETVFVNEVPKEATRYIDHINLADELLKIIEGGD